MAWLMVFTLFLATGCSRPASAPPPPTAPTSLVSDFDWPTSLVPPTPAPDLEAAYGLWRGASQPADDAEIGDRMRLAAISRSKADMWAALESARRAGYEPAFLDAFAEAGRWVRELKSLPASDILDRARRMAVGAATTARHGLALKMLHLAALSGARDMTDPETSLIVARLMIETGEPDIVRDGLDGQRFTADVGFLPAQRLMVAHYQEGGMSAEAVYWAIRAVETAEGHIGFEDIYGAALDEVPDEILVSVARWMAEDVLPR